MPLEEHQGGCTSASVYLHIFGTNSCHLFLNGLHILLAHRVQDTHLLLTKLGEACHLLAGNDWLACIDLGRLLQGAFLVDTWGHINAT